jgi:hypothetical protein
MAEPHQPAGFERTRFGPLKKPQNDVRLGALNFLKNELRFKNLFGSPWIIGVPIDLVVREMKKPSPSRRPEPRY